MQLRFNITLAWRAIRTNKLRSGITIAIIWLGIFALVSILTLVDVMNAAVYTSFSSMGANSFQITSDIIKKSRRKGGMSISFNDGKSIKYDEAVAFKKRFTFPGTIGISVTGTGTATVRYGSEKTNPNIRVMGVDEAYLAVSDTKLEAGRNFSAYDLQTGAYVCILGNGLMEKLFKGKTESAIGHTVSVGEFKYRVIGVTETKGGSMIMDADNIVMIPLANARSVYGGENSYVISVMVGNVNKKPIASEEAEGLFRVIRKIPLGAENNFSVNDNNTLIETLLDVVKYIFVAAIFIGIITVLGSVIGLMNIMLVSVAERTREIGVNKALGAKSSVIKAQFLTEAVIISLIGGLGGIVSGILMGNVIGLLMHTPFIIPWMWIGVTVTICAIVGIVSGIYPAVKASRLDPIASLRYE